MVRWALPKECYLIPSAYEKKNCFFNFIDNGSIACLFPNNNYRYGKK